MLIAENHQQQPVRAETARRSQDYHCPQCHAPVILKRGTTMIAHFAHQPSFDCASFSEGETAEHLQGKRQLAAWFARSGYRVQLEAPLPALHQRPDVLVFGVNQQPLAIEFQCAPLSVQRLAARTTGYREHGYRVWWLLGHPYAKGVTRHGKAIKFLQFAQNWGYYIPIWDVTCGRLTLHYQLANVDFKPLRSRQIQFTSRVAVQRVWCWHPSAHAIIPPVTSNSEAAIMAGRLGANHQLRQLQLACYQHGGSLQQLPAWVWSTQLRPPLLRGSGFGWQLAIFLKLRRCPTRMSSSQLRTLLMTTLRPLLAANACLWPPACHSDQLVDGVIRTLVAFDVIRWTADSWQLHPVQVAWKKH